MTLRAVLVGAGQVAFGYAEDPRMATWFAYATHAQVLAEHPRFEWVGILERDAETRTRVASTGAVPLVTGDIEEIAATEPDVAVLAIPPSGRIDVIERLPTLRAILVEKPLGADLEDAARLLAACRARGIVVQVNLWRRADEQFRALAAGGLRDAVGEVQTVVGIYGKGIRNNGIHLVDFVRMLVGEPERVWPLGEPRPAPASSVPGDVDVFFAAKLASGAEVSFHPIDFGHHREVGLDVWGTTGRLAILQEGLSIVAYPLRPHRAAEGEREIASDEPFAIPSTVGDAFFHMYTNLADAVDDGALLWSDGESALASERVVEAVVGSASADGAAPDRA
jgi:predicted dehydrogenase